LICFSAYQQAPLRQARGLARIPGAIETGGHVAQISKSAVSPISNRQTLKICNVRSNTGVPQAGSPAIQQIWKSALRRRLSAAFNRTCSRRVRGSGERVISSARVVFAGAKFWKVGRCEERLVAA